MQSFISTDGIKHSVFPILSSLFSKDKTKILLTPWKLGPIK